ncbi:hypothetical protein CSUI_006698 [Cystoisospora suis]|uniref:Transmembrane protein n=1 Tax=Cystoisospora suis TaxID=483139 RepID=A0A2C6JZ08_9APIC|nr:hypothetical protein CSUI_006698 [Cystoisospora suis]
MKGGRLDSRVGNVKEGDMLLLYFSLLFSFLFLTSFSERDSPLSFPGVLLTPHFCVSAHFLSSFDFSTGKKGQEVAVVDFVVVHQGCRVTSSPLPRRRRKSPRRENESWFKSFLLSFFFFLVSRGFLANESNRMMTQFPFLSFLSSKSFLCSATADESILFLS